MKTRTALVLLAILVSAYTGRAQAFKDLPGVVPSDATEEYSNKDAPRCTQQVEVPRSDRTHWMPRSVYVCEKNGMTWSSTQPPPSSIRTLRGLDR